MPEIEEDGQSFEETPSKGPAHCAHTGLTTLADDSGLRLSWAGSPGSIQLALPVNRDDEANNRKLLRLMKDVPAEQAGLDLCVWWR